MKKLEKQTKALIVCEIVMMISRMFLDTFLVAYFFQLTNQNVTIISIYYILAHGITALIFWLGGDVIKTKNKTKVYQVGMFLNCIYVLVIGILGEKCKDFYVLLGILYGISQGVYWLGGHAFRSLLIPFEDTKNYISITSILNQIVKITVPILIGTSIELTSFKEVAIAIFILTIIQIIASKKLIQEEDKSVGFNLLHYMKKLNELGLKAQGIKRQYKIAFFEGINSSLMKTLITIVIIMAFHTSFNLGALTTVFSILTIIANMIYKKNYKEKHSKAYIIICTVFPILSVIGLLVEINVVTVILYNIVNAIFIAILENIRDTKRYNCVNKEELEGYKIEHQSMYEICLGLGRVVAYTVLLIVGLLNDIIWFKLLLFMVTLCYIPSSINLYKSNQKEEIKKS